MVEPLSKSLRNLRAGKIKWYRCREMKIIYPGYFMICKSFKDESHAKYRIDQKQKNPILLQRIRFPSSSKHFWSSCGLGNEILSLNSSFFYNSTYLYKNITKKSRRKDKNKKTILPLDRSLALGQKNWIDNEPHLR